MKNIIERRNISVQRVYHPDLLDVKNLIDEYDNITRSLSNPVKRKIISTSTLLQGGEKAVDVTMLMEVIQSEIEEEQESYKLVKTGEFEKPYRSVLRRMILTALVVHYSDDLKTYEDVGQLFSLLIEFLDDKKWQEEFCGDVREVNEETEKLIITKAIDILESLTMYNPGNRLIVKLKMKAKTSLTRGLLDTMLS